MIIDTLTHTNPYADLLPGLGRAFAFLHRDDLDSIEPGRYDLDGDRVFAMVQEYTTRSPDQCVWEAHRRYADVQFIVAGRERMGYAPLSVMSESQAYDADKDAAFYTGEGVLLLFEAGMFAVYLPHDVHMPCVADGGPSEVRKVVVKVQVAE